MAEWDKALSALSSTASWNDPVTCECVEGTVSPPFENLRFYVEPGTYKARVHTTLRNTERWLRVSAPLRLSFVLPVARIRE